MMYRVLIVAVSLGLTPCVSASYGLGESIEDLVEENFQQLEYRSVTSLNCSKQLTDEIVKEFCESVGDQLDRLYMLDLSDAKHITHESLKEVGKCSAFCSLNTICLRGTQVQDKESFKHILNSDILGSTKDFVQISGTCGLLSSQIAIILDEEVYDGLTEAELNGFIKKPFTITHRIDGKSVKGVKELRFFRS